MAVDPGNDTQMDNPQSWNRYAYVRNNPIKSTDPTGMTTGAEEQNALRAHQRAQANAPPTPPATTVLSVTGSVMGGLSGGQVSLGLAFDNQGGVGGVGSIQNSEGLGLGVSLDIGISFQPGTIQDLAHSGQDMSATFAIGEGGSGEICLDDNGDMSEGFGVGYGWGIEGSMTQNQGGTGVDVWHDGSPTPSAPAAPSNTDAPVTPDREPCP